MNGESKVVRAEVVVAATPARAFKLFTEDIGAWWRRNTMYWNDAERAVGLRFEPRPGGRLIEIYDAATGEGFEVGRITTWRPGERLAFSWRQADWAPDMTTEVDVMFRKVAGGTRVAVEHRGFVGAISKIAGGYEAGWRELLGWYGEFAGAA